MAEPSLLESTGNPDVRRFRRHWEAPLPYFAVIFALAAVAFGGSVDPIAALPFACFALITAYFASLRTYVDRRGRTFVVRLPGTTWAFGKGRPIEPLMVRRFVEFSKGRKHVNFKLTAADCVVAGGLNELQGHTLAKQLDEFLAYEPEGGGRARIALPETQDASQRVASSELDEPAPDSYARRAR